MIAHIGVFERLGLPTDSQSRKFPQVRKFTPVNFLRPVGVCFAYYSSDRRDSPVDSNSIAAGLRSSWQRLKPLGNASAMLARLVFKFPPS